jgi:hypothetical protein
MPPERGGMGEVYEAEDLKLNQPEESCVLSERDFILTAPCLRLLPF